MTIQLKFACVQVFWSESSPFFDSTMEMAQTDFCKWRAGRLLKIRRFFSPSQCSEKFQLRESGASSHTRLAFEEPRETATGGLGPTGAGPAGVARAAVGPGGASGAVGGGRVANFFEMYGLSARRVFGKMVERGEFSILEWESKK